MSEATVYRAFDAAGGLLYVGCTKHLEKRLSQHKHGQWWSECARIEHERYTNLRYARARERQLIAEFAPRFNWIHHPSPNPQLRGSSLRPGEVRATFEVPRPLYVEFCAAARDRDQTFSQEMRRFMREYIAERAAA